MEGGLHDDQERGKKMRNARGEGVAKGDSKRWVKQNGAGTELS